MPSRLRCCVSAAVLAAPMTWTACQTGVTEPSTALADASYSVDSPPTDMASAIEKMSRPGEGHHRLTPLVGTFRASALMWSEPKAEPVASEGESTNSWTLGGRFMQQTYRGESTGVPFQGIGLTGYNNQTHQYEGVWIDSLGTMILPVSRGTWDDDGHIITFRREFNDPISGKRIKTREVLTISNEDHHRYEWFQSEQDGAELKTLEVDYVRTGET